MQSQESVFNSPPGNLKEKKQGLSEKILTYFTYILLHFLNYFLSSVPHEKKKEKAFRIFLIILFSLFLNIHTNNNAIVYSHTPAMGVRDHVPCEYFQNNGVIWCIDVYFEDVCLNLFSFLFIEKYWYGIYSIYHTHFPANIS